MGFLYIHLTLCTLMAYSFGVSEGISTQKMRIRPRDEVAGFFYELIDHFSSWPSLVVRVMVLDTVASKV